MTNSKKSASYHVTAWPEYPGRTQNSSEEEPMEDEDEEIEHSLSPITNHQEEEEEVNSHHTPSIVHVTTGGAGVRITTTPRMRVHPSENVHVQPPQGNTTSLAPHTEQQRIRDSQYIRTMNTKMSMVYAHLTHQHELITEVGDRVGHVLYKMNHGNEDPTAAEARATRIFHLGVAMVIGVALMMWIGMLIMWWGSTRR